jgi:tripartite-type tricarboxylate transporter receptor subunit TctC
MRALQLVMVFAASLIAAAPAFAQTADKFPTKPVRLVVGFSPGSATDFTARVFADKLSTLWGQPIVIENRSGAGSTLANASVAQATPDGHTLLVVSTSFAITAVLQGKNLPYDALKDFRGVSQFGSTTGVLVVPPSLGVKSVRELVALAKEKRLLFGSAGAGSGLHMSTERFNLIVGIKGTHVGFKGQPEMNVEIVTGRVHYGFPSLGTSMMFLKDGRLLPLAVNTPKRSPHIPDVPSMFEIVPNFERDGAHALMAPAKTPTPIVQKISKDIARVAEMPDVKERMHAISFDLATTTPEEYDKAVRKQIDLFGQVAKAAGLIAK